MTISIISIISLILSIVAIAGTYWLYNRIEALKDSLAKKPDVSNAEGGVYYINEEHERRIAEEIGDE